MSHFKYQMIVIYFLLEFMHFFSFTDLNSNLTIVGAINNLSLTFPDYPPLTQPQNIDDSQFCDEFHWPAECKGNRLCPCVHRLQVNLNSIVELVIVDESESK